MQLGADHEPSGRRAMTIPEPALPEKTNPALMTWKMASPDEAWGEKSEWWEEAKDKSYLSHVAERAWEWR